MTSIENLYKLFRENPFVCTDTRAIIPGSIFFCLSGSNFNGNKFAKEAIEKGCKYVVIDQEEFRQGEKFLLVENTLKTLQLLANYHRRQMKSRIFGITGSNGKTTSKELISRVLANSFNTLATIGNLNNQIGVPLTLLRITDETEIAVVEMGASKPGDIKELCEIAEPDFGLITNIGKAHLEGMGGYDGVVKTKTELFDFIRNNGGTVFINTNHQVFIDKSKGINVITYGNGSENDVQGNFLSSDPFVKLRWRKKMDQKDFNLLPIIETQLVGYYNYENILAAITIGSFFNVSDEEIHRAIVSYVPQNNRSQIIHASKNTLILDAYNANPTSMEAAISNFSSYPATKKAVVLGKMMELGSSSDIEHERIAHLAIEQGFDKVFLVGELYKKIPQGIVHFPDLKAAREWFSHQPIENFVVLIKGSRANQLEQLIDLF